MPKMMFPRAFALACACSAVLAAGCGGVVSPSQNQKQQFSGTVAPLGQSVNTFSVTKSGEYSVTLDAMNPALNVFLTVFFGQDLGGSCSPITSSLFYAGSIGQEVLTGAITPGSYCVGVLDTGALTTSISYTVTVAHP
ncbi:MAG: hypothetical protein ACM3SQ_09110 [Betaproteobacteria bacterium]